MSLKDLYLLLQNTKFKDNILMINNIILIDTRIFTIEALRYTHTIQ